MLTHPCELIGSSGALKALRKEIELVAPTPVKVLVTGESGVGKELVARLVHQLSSRRRAPFLTVNCAGVPETLLESELFGYTKGSFTGAFRDKPGLLKMLDGGTVFLDEVGEMSPRMQAMLLRFLETGELQPVGGTTVQSSDVRVVAATNRDLTAQVASGAFRADLFYRLRVVQLHVPPLRERKEDIPPLVNHWLSTATQFPCYPAQVSEPAMDLLCRYSWPGNVRELRNAVEWGLVHAKSSTIDVSELSSDIRSVVATSAAVTAPGPSAAPQVNPRPHQAFEAMTVGGQSFWDVVYEPFMRRDLTREDLRQIIQAGLEHTRGSYKILVTLFNMDPGDYKRLLNFLRKHGCHMPFHAFRVPKAKSTAPDFSIRQDV